MGFDEKTLQDRITKSIVSIIQNYDTTLHAAAKYAAMKACQRIQSKAVQCLRDYYANYTPSDYIRDPSDPIVRTFVPYKRINNRVIKKGDVVVAKYLRVEAGLRYDTSVLTMYHSNSKNGKYHPVDGEWIFDNFMNGWHPGTDGSKKSYPANDDWFKSVCTYGQIDTPQKGRSVALYTMNSYVKHYVERYVDKDMAWYLHNLIG